VTPGRVTSQKELRLGAVAAGWGAALIRRPRNEILEVGPQSALFGTDLAAIAQILIGRTSADSTQVAQVCGPYRLILFGDYLRPVPGVQARQASPHQ
jgi:hypothetical protein